VRVGVGKPERKSQVADYVLLDFSPEEMAKLPALITHVAAACKALQRYELHEVKSHYSLKSIEALAT
jgi:PTH1 family peptidyl-tRNA hydrolase